MQEIAILRREYFDRMVNGEPDEWRRAVATWQARRKNSELPDRVLELAQLFDRLHDSSLIDVNRENADLVIKTLGTFNLRFTDVSESVIEPLLEQPPFALLYGEVYPHQAGLFVHFLCDCVDFYIVCKDVRVE